MPAIIDCSYSIEGEGPPLFLIHGIGASRTAWKLALPILTKYFTVISYDLRGHGMSPIPQSKFGLAELVEECVCVSVSDYGIMVYCRHNADARC